MPYLILSDYKKQVQSDNLQQIIGNDAEVLRSAELQAIEEAYGYLAQKYDTTDEFDATSPYSPAVAYGAKTRVYLDATPYSPAATYTLGALCLQNGGVYRCIAAIPTPEAFNAAKWALLGAQYDLFFATLPKPEFNQLQYYRKGDQVWWKGKTYTAQKDSIELDGVTALQYRTYGNLPAPSVFPDDPTNGAAYWGTGTTYEIAVGTPPTDTTKWTKGDNRTQSIVMIVVDIVLFHLHSRIAPRNIPDLRRDRYLNAIDMLKAFARGEMTAKLPVLQPKSGARIRWGGSIKNVNSY